jgi:hypothetical protein
LSFFEYYRSNNSRHFLQHFLKTVPHSIIVHIILSDFKTIGQAHHFKSSEQAHKDIVFNYIELTVVAIDIKHTTKEMNATICAI